MSEYDELGYPKWMNLPMSLWVPEDLKQFLEECYGGEKARVRDEVLWLRRELNNLKLGRPCDVDGVIYGLGVLVLDLMGEKHSV